MSQLDLGILMLVLAVSCIGAFFPPVMVSLIVRWAQRKFSNDR